MEYCSFGASSFEVQHPATHQSQLGVSQFSRFVTGLAHDLLHQTGEWTIQSLVRPYCRNALAVTVNRFTGRSQIGHFVMAITLRLAALRWLMPELTRAARFPSPHVEVLARELVLDLLPQPVEQQRPHRRPQLGAVPT